MTFSNLEIQKYWESQCLIRLFEKECPGCGTNLLTLINEHDLFHYYLFQLSLDFLTCNYFLFLVKFTRVKRKCISQVEKKSEIQRLACQDEKQTEPHKEKFSIHLNWH